MNNEMTILGDITMNRLEKYRGKLAIEEIIETVRASSECVERCAKEGQSVAMFNLAQEFFNKNFVGKREIQEFGCFSAFCLSIFKEQLKGKL